MANASLVPFRMGFWDVWRSSIRHLVWQGRSRPFLSLYHHNCSPPTQGLRQDDLSQGQGTSFTLTLPHCQSDAKARLYSQVLERLKQLARDLGGKQVQSN
ncbi:uncharacterized [Tachysurus ichikawai]